MKLATIADVCSPKQMGSTNVHAVARCGADLRMAASTAVPNEWAKKAAVHAPHALRVSRTEHTCTSCVRACVRACACMHACVHACVVSICT